MLNLDVYSLIITITLALAPSLVWLFFYLKEDPHPEPRYWLLIIFLMGVASAPLVIFLETFLVNFLNANILQGLAQTSILLLLVAPLVEEITKYGIVHLTFNKNPVLDEPVDGMIYLIVSALGFAAIENVLAIFATIPSYIPDVFQQALSFMALRFISAVALHGFASGIVGYFFAVYYFSIEKEKRVIKIFEGLFWAILLHGIYNYLIVRMDEPRYFLLLSLVLGGAAGIIVYLFNRLKYHTEYAAANNVDEETLNS